MALSCFDVVRSRTTADLFLVYQLDFFDRLDTRFCLPLFKPATDVKFVTDRLNPMLEFDGEQYLLATHLALALRVSGLSAALGTLEHEHDRIRDALDLLTLGF